MKRLALIVLLALLPLCALSAQSSESEAQKVKESTGVTEHGPGILWGWANFLLLAGGLGWIVKKNAGPYFAQRSVEIRKGMAEAEAARAASDAKIAEIDARLANLEAEIEALRRTAKDESEADAERLRREGAAEIGKVQAHLAEEIAAAGKSATLELRRYAADLALSLAERKIAARASAETQDRLVRIFVATMAHAVSRAERN
jgi:F-type H+-transporting ATPase subunit b